jgi:hypothetical protein
VDHHSYDLSQAHWSQSQDPWNSPRRLCVGRLLGPLPSDVPVTVRVAVEYAEALDGASTGNDVLSTRNYTCRWNRVLRLSVPEVFLFTHWFYPFAEHYVGIGVGIETAIRTCNPESTETRKDVRLLCSEFGSSCCRIYRRYSRDDMAIRFSMWFSRISRRRPHRSCNIDWFVGR